jgi:hypothetical protein
VPSRSTGSAARAAEVKQRCRTVLQTTADALDAVAAATTILEQARRHGHSDAVPTLDLVQSASAALKK